MDKERLEEYQNRVAEWIGEQGIIFQLRYAGIVGNYGIAKQFGNLLVKLAVFIVAVIGIASFFLNRHFGTDHYRKNLSAQMSEVLGADEIEVGDFNRARGQGTFREIELSGSSDSFFIEGSMEMMTAPFTFLSGFSERWQPSDLSITRASFQLKAGGEEEEMEAAFRAILETFEHQKLKAVTVEKLDIDWGYSKLTYGAIQGSHFRASFVDDRWEVNLKGGKFSQNWLQQLDLVEAQLIVTSTGVEVESLNLKMNEGTLNLSGFIGGTLGMPEFDLSGQMKSISFGPLIQLSSVRVRDFLSGTISGELKITGSTNRRIITTGQVTLEDADMVTMREKLEILKTMSVLDINRSYRRVDFDEGSFEFKTSGGGLEINEVNLRAGNLMKLRGGLLSYLPSQKEAAEALGIVLTDGFGNSLESDLTDESAAQTLENDRMTLKRVTNGGKVNDFTLDVGAISQSGDVDGNLSPKELEDQRLRYEMNVHRVQANLALGIRDNAVVNYRSLKQLYPRDEEGWRWIPLEALSTFSKMTQAEAVRLLEDSRIKIKKAPETENRQ